MSRARTCGRCVLSLVSAGDVGTDVRLARSPAVRASEVLHDRCPDCATRLARLSLEWDGVGRARIEECSFCGVLVVDGNEHVRVAAIVEATRALGEGAVERLVELARDSLPPDAPR